MTSKIKKTLPDIDQPFLFGVLALLCIGLLMIASAGVFYGETRFNDSYFFFKRQLIGLSIGLVLAYLFSRISYRVWRSLAVPIFLFALVLLILVFIPGVGTTAYGAARWIELGPVSFQPSEVMKLAMILYLSAWLSGKGKAKTEDFYEGFVPFLAILFFVAFLILKQPDTGTLFLIFATALSIFFYSGANWKHIVGMIGFAGITLLFLIKAAPYRMQRLLVFMNPEHDPQGAGYQITQALVAIGSGGFFGVGLGYSHQKFNYLPEPVTDSIFAIFGEEFGFIGACVLIVMFVFLAVRGMRIARNAPDRFGELLGIGIASWITIQAFINIAAISGLIPLTGVPLPFVSYGGTSLAVLLSAVGILLNISRQAKLKM
jgi:cell division protein FtsW